MDIGIIDPLIGYLRSELDFENAYQYYLSGEDLFPLQNLILDKITEEKNTNNRDDSEKELTPSLDEDDHQSSESSSFDYVLSVSFNDSESYGNDREVKPSHNKKLSKTSLKRKRSSRKLKWSIEENEKLRKLVKKYGGRNWKQIAKELGTNRLDTECRQHYCRVLERKSTKGRWSSSETSRLVEAVGQERSWLAVALIVGTRDRNQCILKWKQLNRVSYGGRNWSLEDHRLMVQLYKKLSPCWELIANELGNGISTEDVIFHYNVLNDYDCFK